MGLYDIGGSIPCSGCWTNIVTGIVHKIGVETFVCDDCYEGAIEMHTAKDNGLEQFEEREL